MQNFTLWIYLAKAFLFFNNFQRIKLQKLAKINRNRQILTNIVICYELLQIVTNCCELLWIVAIYCCNFLTVEFIKNKKS